MAAGERFFLKPETGESIELVADILLGRSDDCDLVLTQGHPSRRHAQISISDEGVSIEDLGSANGSFLNGERLSVKKLLHNGDELKFDIMVYGFVVEGQEPVPDAGNQTIIRSVEDLQQTIIRPAAELMAEIEAAAGKPQAVEEAPVADIEPPAPKAPIEKTSSAGAAKAAGSWVANQASGEGTQVFTREQLAEMAAQLSGGDGSIANSSAVPCLRIVGGASEGSEFRMSSTSTGGEWTIGSDDSRDIILKDEGVSAFHAKIIDDGKRWKVVDQMSANGTFVNDTKALTSFLGSGDHIRVGTVECVIVLPGSTDNAKSSPGASQGAKKTANGALAKALLTGAVVLGLLGALYFIFG